MKILERIILILCILFFLTGCHQQQNEESVETVSTTTYPKEENESKKPGQLKVVPWNSKRCEETSNFTIAETESGWYLLHTSWLYYADKSNPSNWVLLCNKPDCEHYDQCNALISTTGFLVSENSIWHTASKMDIPQYADSFSSDIVIVQMDLNGANKKIALDVKDASLGSSGGQAHYFMGDYWVYIVSELNPDGTANTRGIRISASGADTFLSRTDADINAQISGARNQFVIYGDKYFYSAILDETGSKIFRFEGDSLVELDIGDFPVKGSYLSGNVLRCLRPGDGYYDIDLTSGKEVRIDDIQLVGSYAAVLMPNCILESTLLFPDSLSERQPGMEHSMRLFDGVNWHDVQLPDELRFAATSRFLTPRCITSDRILLSHYVTETIIADGNDNEEPTVYVFTDLVLYQIYLDADGYKLEYFATVKQPRINTEKG